jgi:hypothetical protein
MEVFMLRKSIVPRVALFAVVSLSSPLLRAEYVSGSGSACRTASSSADYYLYLKNTSFTTGFTAYCPLNLGQISAVWNADSQLIVRYTHWNGSTTAPFSCIAKHTGYDGVVDSSSPVYPCATPGGCSSPDFSYKGVGYLAISVPTSSIAIDGPVMLECTLPPRGNDGQIGIISYYLQ